MKRVFTSAGILALGAASLHAYDPEMTRQVSGRPWTVSASVRGFYDDNVATAHDKRNRVESFGAEVSPSVHLNLPFEQTFLGLGYIYTLRWYENREPDEIDQAHQFNAKLRHQFSPRHSISVDEAFILTSEPTIAEQNGIITSPIRTEGDIIHNRGAIDYTMGLTPRVALGLGYENNWYDYEQDGPGSRSALLDRLQHLFRADARYQFNPTLVGLVGYSFGMSSYTGDDFLLSNAERFAVQNDPTLTPDAIRQSLGLMSDSRDSYTHYAYVGADYDLTAKLRASARVGGSFTSYSEFDEDSVSPYADASLSYTYLPGSAVIVGVRHDRSATDIASPDREGRPTLDAEATSVYAQVNHRITHRLTGSLIGQFQTMRYNDGGGDGFSDDLYLVGVNFNYSFNRHLSAEAGYNYDLLCSEIDNRGYYRNRVYVGVRATY